MTPADPRAVRAHFRAVVARGLSRAEREEQAHEAKLRAMQLRALPEEIALPVIPVATLPRAWPSPPGGALARARAVAVRKRKRVVVARLERLVPARRNTS